MDATAVEAGIGGAGSKDFWLGVAGVAECGLEHDTSCGAIVGPYTGGAIDDQGCLLQYQIRQRTNRTSRSYGPVRRHDKLYGPDQTAERMGYGEGPTSSYICSK